MRENGNKTGIKDEKEQKKKEEEVMDGEGGNGEDKDRQDIERSRTSEVNSVCQLLRGPASSPRPLCQGIQTGICSGSRGHASSCCEPGLGRCCMLACCSCEEQSPTYPAPQSELLEGYSQEATAVTLKELGSLKVDLEHGLESGGFPDPSDTRTLLLKFYFIIVLR